MVEKFAALSLEKENFSLENLSLPKLEINSTNLSLLLEKNLIEKEKPTLALCPGAEFGPQKDGHQSIILRLPRPIYLMDGMYLHWFKK